MGLLRPYEQKDPEPIDEPDQIAPVETPDRAPDGRKLGPTPTRKEAEAARMQRLHPKLSKKERKKREREAEAIRRSRTFAEYEDQPERQLMRNYIDSRHTLTEHMWPILLVLMVLAIISNWLLWLVIPVTIVMWIAIAGSILNVYLMWIGFKRELRFRFPGASTRGMFWTFTARMMTLPRVRNPGVAVVKGGIY